MIEVEQVTEPLTHHGEGPVWDARKRTLYWVDMLAGDVLSMEYEGKVVRQRVGAVAAAVRPRRSGGLVIAVERGFALLDSGATEPRMVAEIWQDPTMRMNDGGCDPQGRFYCGSMAYDAAVGRGSLYRLDPDCSVDVVLDGLSISNGIVWNAAGDTVYYIDTPTQRVDAFDFDPEKATFSNRRPVVHIPADHGGPDGMTLDAEGCLWVALWQGGAVHRYTPDGQLDAVIELPATKVTACAFGGPDLDDLYITTSRMDIPEGAEPPAGALFRARPGVRGRPVGEFAG